MKRGYETSDWPVGQVALWGLASCAGFGLLLAAAWWTEVLLGFRGPDVPPAGTSRADAATPWDDVPVAPDGYVWVDRAAGIVQVPLQRAAELLLEEGFPVRPEAGR